MNATRHLENRIRRLIGINHCIVLICRWIQSNNRL